MCNFTKSIRALAADEAGAAALVIAISLMVIVGAAGLAIDVGSWYNTERRLQMAADAAAVSAAFEISAGKTAAQAAAVALKEAQKAGFTGAACDVNTAGANLCQVYNPPKTSPHTSDSKAVEVILTQPTEAHFASMFLSKSPDAKASSIMSASSGSGSYCLLALDPDDANAVYLENNATVKCGVASNSSSSTALNMENNAIVVGNAYAVGSLKMKNNAEVQGNAYASAISKANNAKVTGSSTVKPTEAMTNPYAAFTPASSDLTAACTDSPSNKMTCKNNCTKTIQPGRYCYGWDFQNNATVTLADGVYVIETQLILKNNAKIKQEAAANGGVTIILKGNYAMDVGNNATWDFKAPTSGTYSGMAFHSLPTNSSAVTQTFQNNAIIKLTGAIYAPSQKVYFENNATISQTECTQVVARLIDVRNNGNFGTACTGTGTQAIGSGTAIKTLM